MTFTKFSISIICVLSCLVACTTPGRQEQHASLPNLILIMADDLGYGGISCYGNSAIRTPNLDRMAREGIRFTNYYANSTVCTPTRAALLTGRYQQRCGLEGVIYVKGPTRQAGMPPQEVTLAELLKTKGYATGIMGKWHLGYQPRFFPHEQGFDEFYGYVSGNIDFHTHYDNAGIYDWWHNQDSLIEPGYVTDLITKHSVEFIEKHREEPFFLYIPHEAPHAPFQGRDDPGYRFPGEDFSYYGPVADKDAAYREMVEVMDEGIGTVLATLEKYQLEQNTLVVFVSDNGAEQNYGDNGKLRGWKTNLFEGGIRVPGIAWWPGQIEAASSDVPVMSFDWMPTFLNLAHTKPPDTLALDGLDLSAFLLHQEPLPDRSLFWRYRDQKAVRDGKWKLLVDEKQGKLLFDLQTDPQESENLAGQQPAVLERLSDQLQDWEREFPSAESMITQ